MTDDHLPARKQTVHEIGQDLSPLSIAELDARIGALQAEIARLEAARHAKRETQAAADALFRR